MKDIGIDIPFNDFLDIFRFITAIKIKSLTLKDVGITSRVFNGWRSADLIPDAGEENKWTRLDFTQYLWLKMVQDLRQFGLPHATIADLKKELFTPQPNYEPKELFTSDHLEAAQDRFSQIYEGYEPKNPDLDGPSFFPGKTNRELFAKTAPFDTMLLIQMAFRSATSILITYTGEFFFISDFLENKVTLEGKDVPHINLPLSHYLFQFLSDKTKEAFLPQLPLLSEEEAEVIRTMRKGHLKHIKIIFKKNGKKQHIDIETTKEIELTLEQTDAITQLLALHDYDSVDLKKHNGSRLFFEKTKRKQL